MVTPERGWDARFDGDALVFQTRMKLLIRARFADILGDDVELLNQPDGLDRLSAKYLARLKSTGPATPARVVERVSAPVEAELVEAS
ncbi:MAG: hypothetical protein HYZ53_16295 [Planctomycetes bacterium]|nr:hypothetical protein [Planctomycetota bacterium]